MTNLSRLGLGALVAGVLASSAATANVFYISGEAAGVVNSTAAFSAVGVETFDGRVGTGDFTTNFGGASGLGGLTGAFAGVFAVQAGASYGGVGGSDFITNANNTYTLTLSQNVTYFGMWASAVNDQNIITLKDNGTTVLSFDVAAMGTLFSGDPAYNDNPSGPFAGPIGEPSLFLNIFSQTGTFNSITITGAGFEADNFTVGTFTATAGIGVVGSPSVGSTEVPEPASLGALTVGLGALLASRRRRRLG